MTTVPLLAAAAQPGPNLFQQLLDASIPIGTYQLHYLEVLGVLIGIVSAWFGMRRAVWAWPVGIVANVILFFVYLGALVGADQRIPLLGQAGRQVFFIVVSVYGWVTWAALRRRRGGGGAPAVDPRWMTARERAVVVAGWLLGTVLVHQVFQAILDANPNPYYTPAWWFSWCDAWIFVGSVVATYAMARGWNEFWLAWIGVDLVGVPLGFATGYVPTSVMYVFYGMFVLYGFSQWVRVTRAAGEAASHDDVVAPVA
ncbi:nicotinamide riboside transporter PnuC [Phycicoccus jejuensis]|uniref:nicotinamide riboside transporter PnuC n=1 Tax=Phycicoccus jejuensis TaxID=367299 RepID=UPI00068DA3F4|nr:nicotinamide riboside transporter PnuC [Phycicoccus jejuensis]